MLRIAAFASSVVASTPTVFPLTRPAADSRSRTHVKHVRHTRRHGVDRAGRLGSACAHVVGRTWGKRATGLTGRRVAFPTQRRRSCRRGLIGRWRTRRLGGVRRRLGPCERCLKHGGRAAGVLLCLAGAASVRAGMPGGAVLVMLPGGFGKGERREPRAMLIRGERRAGEVLVTVDGDTTELQRDLSLTEIVRILQGRANPPFPCRATMGGRPS